MERNNNQKFINL